MGDRRTIEEKKRGGWRPERTDRFARLAHQLLDKPAYRALSPNARALLVEFAMMYNPKNNGALWLSVRDAADRMGVADPRVAGATLDELKEAGFVAMTADAHFAVKAGDGSRARCWRITWEGIVGRTFHPATNDFLTREPPPGTRARKRMEAGLRALKRWRKQEQGETRKIPVEDFATPMPDRVAETPTTKGPSERVASERVEDFATHLGWKGGNPPIAVVEESATHIAIPSSRGEAGRPPASPAPSPALDELRPSPVTALRGRLQRYLGEAPHGSQGRLACRANLRDAEVSKFRHGGRMTEEKRSRLAAALAGEQADADDRMGSALFGDRSARIAAQ
jgi:hypothetical protein